MGLFSMLKPGREEVRTTKAALDAAASDDLQKDPGVFDRLVEMLVDTGLEGRGPLRSAARAGRRGAGEERRRPREGHRGASPVRPPSRAVSAASSPASAASSRCPSRCRSTSREFYVQAVRMVGAIATLRGYDIDEPRVRTAVLLTLVGSDSDEVLKKAGMATASGRLTSYRPPRPAAGHADDGQQGRRLPPDARRQREAAQPVRPRHPARRRPRRRWPRRLHDEEDRRPRDEGVPGPSATT